MRIATAPVNWNNPDVPEYRPWLPYERMMDEFVEAGYDATEWGPGMPEDPAQLKVELEKRGLEMVGAFVGLPFRDKDRYDEAMERGLTIAHRLHATGGKLLIAAEAGDDRRRGEAGHVDEANGLTDEQWKNLAQGLHDLADRIAPLGMSVVFHNHVGTYVETQAETARFLDETDPAKVGWCLDIGHLAYGGGNSLSMLADYGDRVRHIHLKDVDGAILDRAKVDAWSFGTALKAYIFPPLGEGIAQVEAVVTELVNRGYDGWFVLEQDTCSGDPKDVAHVNREWLEATLARIDAAAGAVTG
jgi:inosose dehydratase